MGIHPSLSGLRGHQREGSSQHISKRCNFTDKSVESARIDDSEDDRVVVNRFLITKEMAHWNHTKRELSFIFFLYRLILNI